MPLPYEWTVIRVVPRVERGESVNVGVVVYCRARDYLGVLTTDDLSRAVALAPALDVAGIRAHLGGVRALCQGLPEAGANGDRPPGERFRWLVAPRSTVVQAAPVHTGLTDDPAAELQDLFARMVEPTSVAGALRVGGRVAGPGDTLIMAIVNRTPDSFFDAGATYDHGPAMERVHTVVAEGADLVDIGGVKAGAGDVVPPAEEIRRVVDFVAAVRASYPDLPISVDTWRAEVGRLACEAGADVLNDAWGGHDPALAEVAARYGVGLVCTHAGGMTPRTTPHRVGYDDVVADVVAATTGLAERALALGVPRERIVIDPGHDFAKNTWHSLEVTRRLPELVGTGWPVLVALSNKDFVGETLDLPVGERLTGTLAATAVCAWHGARVFRAHQVAATRQVLDMVASIRGDRPPFRVMRGLV
ncbi:MAG: dihydropteroate synthase [Geodermatophilaceae bacterium]|nr:dihydropteroate synthase [Geodermatophilaceae bacterium]